MKGSSRHWLWPQIPLFVFKRQKGALRAFQNARQCLVVRERETSCVVCQSMKVRQATGDWYERPESQMSRNSHIQNSLHKVHNTTIV
jgi:hypothetical protein